MKKHFEAALLRLTAWIIDRDMQRAKVISRKDNNWLFEAHYELHEIANRISREYKEN